MAEKCDNGYKYPIYTGPLFQCAYCHMMFISNAYLSKHQNKCIHMKLYSIFKWQLEFKSKKDYSKVPPTNDKLEDYFCDMCFSGFYNLSEYESHKCDHNLNYDISLERLQPQIECEVNITIPNAREFQCNKCAASFPNATYLTLHYQTVHMMISPNACASNPSYPNLPIAMVTSTSITTPSTNHLISHLKNKSVKKVKEKRFSCEECHIRFATKSSLKDHSRIHSGEKPYQCPHCLTKFSQRSTLKSHILIHTGEKPYQCSFCLMKFKEKSSLNKHFTIHTGERKHECEFCNARFSRRDYLTRHLKIHTGEKPHFCDHCSKTFSRKDNFTSHMRKHAKEKLNESTNNT